MATIAITAEFLDELERAYAPASEQKCRVCGAPLQFYSSGRGHLGRYACSSDDVSALRSKLPTRERLEHLDASIWIDQGRTGPAVVDLVRACRALFDGLTAELEEKIPDQLVRDEVLAIIAARRGVQ